MTKPTPRKVKAYLTNIPANFSELISSIIWFETRGMDDWSYDIISHIEKLPTSEELTLLFDDLSNRNADDLSNPLYQKLWYALFNVDQQLENTHAQVVYLLQTHSNKEIAQSFLQLLDEGGDSDGEINIRKILDLYNSSIQQPTMS